jgi:hypothetical protein
MVLFWKAIPQRGVSGMGGFSDSSGSVTQWRRKKRWSSACASFLLQIMAVLAVVCFRDSAIAMPRKPSRGSRHSSTQRSINKNALTGPAVGGKTTIFTTVSVDTARDVFTIVD